MRARILALLLVAACVSSPPPRDSLPDLAEAVDPPTGCLFLVGEPQGVAIDEVIAGSAAEGLLREGDTLVAVDGEPTPDTGALLSVLSGHRPGDGITLSVRREGGQLNLSLTLGANPDDPARPMIGVMVETRYQTIRADEASGPAPRGATTRPVTIAGTVYLLDPVTAAWERTRWQIPADQGWVATTQRIYTVTRADPPVVTDLTTGEVVEHDGAGGWEPARVLGTVGADLLLALTADIPDRPGFVTIALSRFDPVRERTVWVNQVREGMGVPATAFGSPDGSRIVVVGTDEESVVSIQVLDSTGAALPAPGLADLGTPFGWFDQRSIAFLAPDGSVSVYSLDSGGSASYTPAVTGGTLLATGDGVSLLGLAGRSLVVDDLTSEGEVRTLAENCLLGRVGEPGWDA